MYTCVYLWLIVPYTYMQYNRWYVKPVWLTSSFVASSCYIATRKQISLNVFWPKMVIDTVMSSKTLSICQWHLHGDDRDCTLRYYIDTEHATKPSVIWALKQLGAHSETDRFHGCPIPGLGQWQCNFEQLSTTEDWTLSIQEKDR